MLADKLCKSRLVAYLVIRAVVSKKYVRAATHFATDRTDNIVAEVVLTSLSAQGTYAIYPFVVAFGRNDSLKTAHGTGVVILGIEVMLASLSTCSAYTVRP